MAVMRNSLHNHEVMGLILKFFGTTCYGVGIFFAITHALRPMLLPGSEVSLIFFDVVVYMLFFGIGSVLNALGTIELRQMKPSKYR